MLRVGSLLRCGGPSAAARPPLARAQPSAAARSWCVRPRYQLARGLATEGDKVLEAVDKGAHEYASAQLDPRFERLGLLQPADPVLAVRPRSCDTNGAAAMWTRRRVRPSSRGCW